ncbi:GNAT family N-acetyltransferase [Deinococcus multiflagellatus]|uniref:GNAT family N-acetyltransferase n=1 Tax=Deinococcus multiflagellatus TaxID=1656887 RepID=A0ABW1ZJJ9_9DEIO|nr:GNAT family N-acetyltransferase [Deinococcus multiflagellatus]MBZ9713276.1 GNAT family N-acetyltransferase [Deinococcus multiflagellatus]
MLSEPGLTPATEALLRQAMFPDPDRMAAELDRYRQGPRLVLAWAFAGQVVSAVGLEVNGDAATILHLGTHPDHARQGHARTLLREVARHLNLRTLTAETDDEAAGFYRRCGFVLQAMPSPWSRARYRCEWVA